ncbi:MAG: sulfurtransferase TusA family protein [Pseudomonadota bacterium]|nr:sulfurtransferase TusA family protein [Pseudomonadota bacterium]
MRQNHVIDHELDITRDVCPMTFVKVRLMIEKMEHGEILAIRLCGDEPIKNVPDSLVELGHSILSLESPDEKIGKNTHVLRVQKK